MTDTRTIDDYPYFPAPAPAVFSDAAATADLVRPVLAALAGVVDVPAAAGDAPTPCASYTVTTLRDHVLGWLQHFADAVTDPDRTQERADPVAYLAAADDRAPSEVVRDSARRIEAALAGDVLGRQVVMSQARMDGPAVLAMALGEYLIHGWDLAAATSRAWTPSEDACEAALEFFGGMITPEYRSEDGAGGMFGPELPMPDDAPALHRLLGFAGRDPSWTAART